MSEKTQFKIESAESGLNYGRYKVEPLQPGYGTTIGNALRRILLRSLEGVAVSRIHVGTVWHEFSTIEHVREDVTEIVLNLKRIRLKRMMDMDGEVRAHLYARGEGSTERVVTAGDVAWPAEVEVINPDQPIATLDSADAVLDMDIWVSRNRGYRPAETQEIRQLGDIPIDAIYTPIERVNFVVEHTRVGPMTDFDRLILEILTDGTIEPDDALAQSAQILMDHARIFAEFNRKDGDVVGAVPFLSDEVQNRPLNELGLSPRVLNALRSRQIDKVGQVLTMDPEQLLSIRNFGPRSLTELRQKLVEYGYLQESEMDIFAGAGLYDGLDDGGEDDEDGIDTQEVAEAIASLRNDDSAAVRADAATNGEDA